MKAISIALDDYVIGAISVWPLNTFVSFSSKVMLLHLATLSYDGNLIVKVCYLYLKVILRLLIIYVVYFQKQILFKFLKKIVLLVNILLIF